VLNDEVRRQDVHAVAPSSDEKVLPVQDWQGSFAVVSLKRPARHMLHRPADGWKPGSHRQ